MTTALTKMVCLLEREGQTWTGRTRFVARHAPVTAGAKPVWTCSGCALYKFTPPDPTPADRQSSLLDMYRSNTFAVTWGLR